MLHFLGGHVSDARTNKAFVLRKWRIGIGHAGDAVAMFGTLSCLKRFAFREA